MADLDKDDEGTPDERRLDRGQAKSKKTKAAGGPHGDADESRSVDDAPSKKKTKKEIGTRKRGVETMFRTAYRANLDLTSLADSKANMMISINGLILSIILGTIAPKIDTNVWLIVPTVTILLGCVIAIIYAVLAARPRLSPSTNLSLEDAIRNDANLLFFGNVSQLTEEEYLKGLEWMLTDRDAVYRNMMRDLYGMARVLTKKFALLRTSYTVFMVGIALSVLAFIVVFILEARAGA